MIYFLLQSRKIILLRTSHSIIKLITKAANLKQRVCSFISWKEFAKKSRDGIFEERFVYLERVWHRHGSITPWIAFRCFFQLSGFHYLVNIVVVILVITFTPGLPPKTSFPFEQFRCVPPLIYFMVSGIFGSTSHYRWRPDFDIFLRNIIVLSFATSRFGGDDLGSYHSDRSKVGRSISCAVKERHYVISDKLKVHNFAPPAADKEFN